MEMIRKNIWWLKIIKKKKREEKIHPNPEAILRTGKHQNLLKSFFKVTFKTLR